ncbi:MAG: hypothetical protein AAF214_04200 [Pseudomonadota bacterium]
MVLSSLIIAACVALGLITALLGQRRLADSQWHPSPAKSRTLQSPRIKRLFANAAFMVLFAVLLHQTWI